ncbi:unnamed protein product [Prunus armeniaca]|uniref:Uncharacterized protein n=1 Tax=Prunus armeniaca TaxID=36596 RepID=A0A6J5XJF4_PRUAR|nr:unnamed protein product [Prunus armeniaca]
MGEKLGNYLGSFVMVDHGLNRDCLGSFLCIRVGLKISEPQKRCVTLRLALDELAKLYEIELDHVGSNCELKQTRDITMERYGSWKTMLKDGGRDTVGQLCFTSEGGGHCSPTLSDGEWPGRDNHGGRWFGK